MVSDASVSRAVAWARDSSNIGRVRLYPFPPYWLARPWDEKKYVSFGSLPEAMDAIYKGEL